MNKSDRAAFGRLENAVKLSRYGGDFYAYCMLAAGLIDLVIETEISLRHCRGDPISPAPAASSPRDNGPAQGAAASSCR